MSQIQKVSVVDAVVEAILERIEEGVYSPGTALPSERLLQEEFQVSRLALREALARLTALGIIQVRHGKGAQVAQQVEPRTIRQALLPLLGQDDPQLQKEFIQTRNILEGEMSALAAQHRSEKEVAELEAHFREGQEHLHSWKELAKWDLEFHLLLCRMAHNRFLGLLYESLAPHILEFLERYTRLQQANPELVVDRHQPILDAVRTGDAELARRYAQAHSQECYRSMEKKSC